MSINVTPTIIGTSKLMMGVQPEVNYTHHVWDTVIQDRMRELNVKLIRNFDWRDIRPCSQWNGASANSVWNWTIADQFVNAVRAIPAEPMICFSWASPSYLKNPGQVLPVGMNIDPATGLPNPNEFADYCSEWVRHYGDQVLLYEIFNEAYNYLGTCSDPQYTSSSTCTKAGYTWKSYDPIKMERFLNVWKVVAPAMRAINPNIHLSYDLSESTTMMNYWLANNGPDLDSIEYHKYDSGDPIYNLDGTFRVADATLFDLAETNKFTSAWTSQSKYAQQRAKVLPIFNTEGNMNSAWSGGVDPRIHQIIGGVWLAINLAKSLASGVSYFVYYTQVGQQKADANVSWGFGMLDSGVESGENGRRFIPFHVAKMFCANLSIGDSIFDTIPSDSMMRSVAWNHGSTLNIVLINKDHNVKSRQLQGVSGNFASYTIDENTDVFNPSPREAIVDVSQPITIDGYTVMLLQQTVTPQSLPFHDALVNLDAWSSVKGTWAPK